MDKTTTPNRLDTYCGLYCGACVVYQANCNGTATRLTDEFGLKPDDVTCNGCRSSVNSNCAKSCRIKPCAQENNVEFCFECPDYPCNHLVEFKNDKYLHRSFVINNLEEIKKSGYKKWTEEQQKRWKCAECNEPFHWYEDTCKKCGTAVFNCVRERNQ
ncbi:MAG: DUF3795 domain-containing protein [Bacteroidota bacterium]